MLGKSEQTTERTVKSTVTEYFWRFTARWRLVVVPGNDEAAQVVLSERQGGCVLCTGSGGSQAPPVPAQASRTVAACELTWLLEQLAPAGLRSRSCEHDGRRNCVGGGS